MKTVDFVDTDFGPVTLTKKTIDAMDKMAPGWRVENKTKRWKATKAGKAAIFAKHRLVSTVYFAAQLKWAQGEILNEF
jgi:hypothetical protein